MCFGNPDQMLTEARKRFRSRGAAWDTRWTFSSPSSPIRDSVVHIGPDALARANLAFVSARD